MMSPDTVKRVALMFCMQGTTRYLDCLNMAVVVNADNLPKDFVSEVRRDFEEYATKMEAAGLPVKRFVNGEFK